MTLMNHVNRTDDEIISLSGINLVYLGATTYGIIRDICTPHLQPELNPTPPKTPGQTLKHAGKVTCRSGSHGRKTSGKSSTGCGRGSCGKNITNTQRIKTTELWYICYKCDTTHCLK